MSEIQPPRAESATRDHLANQRTFLAWVRTAITFVGLGFAVDQLLLEDALGPVLGVAMMLVGGGMMVPALLSYRRIERAIDTGVRAQPLGWTTPLAMVVIGGSIVLVLFSLAQS